MTTFKEIIQDPQKLGRTIDDKFYALTDNGCLYFEAEVATLPPHHFSEQQFAGVTYWLAPLKNSGLGYPLREEFRPRSILKINCHTQHAERDEFPDAILVALNYCVDNNLKAILTNKSLQIVGTNLVG